MGKGFLKKLALVLLTMITVIAGSTMVYAERDLESGDWWYKVKGDSVIITGYRGSDDEVEIPDVIDGKSVTSIGDYAFSECFNMTSIIIPDSVTSIGVRAFEFCYSLTSIEIPASVNEINPRAFCRMEALTEIKVADGNSKYTSKIGSEECNGIFSLDGTELVVGCKNTKLVNGIKRIGDCAFYVLRCEEFTSISIPDSVTSIGNGAFYDCTYLKEINIPDGVTSIGIGAFYYCNYLKEINIPDGVTSIGRDAFLGCSDLSSITIPSSVTSLGECCIAGCYSLSKVVNNSNVSIDLYAATSSIDVPWKDADTGEEIDKIANGTAIRDLSGVIKPDPTPDPPQSENKKDDTPSEDNPADTPSENKPSEDNPADTPSEINQVKHHLTTALHRMQAIHIQQYIILMEVMQEPAV